METGLLVGQKGVSGVLPACVTALSGARTVGTDTLLISFWDMKPSAHIAKRD